MQIAVTRTIDIFVNDSENKPLPGATIKFLLDGKDAGEVVNAQGRGRIEKVPPSASVEVVVTFDNIEKRVKLARGQTNYTFNLEVTSPSAERTILWIGIALVAAAVALAFWKSDATPLQHKVILALLCVGLAGIATRITGFLRADLKFSERLIIGSGGAFALFVILWFTSPS